MRSKEFFALTCIILLLPTSPALAWGPAGHRIVGSAAHALLDAKARKEVDAILAFDGSGDPAAALNSACNWPDEIRDTSEWEWSAPLHYVNIPRSTRHYAAQRDCPDGICVTAGITRFANELTRRDLTPEKRWQALAFLCHLAGDIHQPLHAGFRDDRGANRVNIEYRGKEWNLHRFWDSVLTMEKRIDEDQMISTIVAQARPDLPLSWSPSETVRWTEESHDLAANEAYPEGRHIDSEFAEKAWDITQSQWLKASMRLALILNAVLGEAELALTD